MNEQITGNRADDPSSPAPGDQGFLWRAWPCDECSGQVTPIGHLLRSTPASSGIPEDRLEEGIKAQSNSLLAWLECCCHTHWQVSTYPFLAAGSEHAVFLHAERAQVIKLTLPGVFGDSYYLEENRIFQKKCTPFEYLLRLHFWKKLYRGAPASLGMTREGQIISSQRFIKGSTPSQEEVDDFLISSGLTDVRRKFWLWRRDYKNFDIWVGDTRADNFVLTREGMVPIDLRIWLVTYDPVLADPK